MLLSLGDRVVGGAAPALLVAEIGSRHDGDLARALALIDAAADAGADAVQFHSYRAARLLARGAAAGPAAGAAADTYARLERTELRTEWHAVLRACDRAEAALLVGSVRRTTGRVAGSPRGAGVSRGAG